MIDGLEQEEFHRNDFGSFAGIDEDPSWQKDMSMKKTISKNGAVGIDIDRIVIDNVYDVDITQRKGSLGRSYSLANSENERLDVNASVQTSKKAMQTNNNSIECIDEEEEYQLEFQNTLQPTRGIHMTEQKKANVNQQQQKGTGNKTQRFSEPDYNDQEYERRNTFIQSESNYELDPNILINDMASTNDGNQQFQPVQFPRQKNTDGAMSLGNSGIMLRADHRNSVRDYNGQSQKLLTAMLDDIESVQPNNGLLKLSVQDDNYLGLKSARNHQDTKSEFDFNDNDDGTSQFSTMDIDLEEIEDRILELQDTVQSMINAKEMPELFKINISAYSIERAKIQQLIFKFKQVRTIREDEDKIQYILDQEDDLIAIHEQTYELAQQLNLNKFLDQQGKEQNKKFDLVKLEDQSKQANKAYDKITKPLLEEAPVKQNNMPLFLKKVKSRESSGQKFNPNINIKMYDSSGTPKQKSLQDSDLTNDTPIKQKRISLQNIQEKEDSKDDMGYNLTPRGYTDSNYSIATTEKSHINYIENIDKKVANLQQMASDHDEQVLRKNKDNNKEWLKDIKKKIQNPNVKGQDKLKTSALINLDTIPEQEYGSNIYGESRDNSAVLAIVDRQLISINIKPVLIESIAEVPIGTSETSRYDSINISEVEIIQSPEVKIEQEKQKTVHILNINQTQPKRDFNKEPFEFKQNEISQSYQTPSKEQYKEKLLNNAKLQMEPNQKSQEYDISQPVKKKSIHKEIQEPVQDKCCCTIF